ncbi:LOW QUALITY PROTEIN: Coiled-coil domain-containing protein 127, partial [Galemys pyrenaicus]
AGKPASTSPAPRPEAHEAHGETPPGLVPRKAWAPAPPPGLASGRDLGEHRLPKCHAHWPAGSRPSSGHGPDGSRPRRLEIPPTLRPSPQRPLQDPATAAPAPRPLRYALREPASSPLCPAGTPCTTAPPGQPPRGAHSQPRSALDAGCVAAATRPGPPTCQRAAARSHQPPRQTAPAQLATQEGRGRETRRLRNSPPAVRGGDGGPKSLRLRSYVCCGRGGVIVPAQGLYACAPPRTPWTGAEGSARLRSCCPLSTAPAHDLNSDYVETRHLRTGACAGRAHGRRSLGTPGSALPAAGLGPQSQSRASGAPRAWAEAWYRKPGSGIGPGSQLNWLGSQHSARCLGEVRVRLEGAAGRRSGSVSMNNLNDPPNWNIRPNSRADGGDGSRWNYALLVPMLGLAAFRWIWSRESQKEVERERAACRQSTAAFQQDLEAKYRATLSENRRALAQLSLELEKEQNRTASYREALISQGRKLVEEKKLLEQERAQVMREKRQPLRSAYLSCLKREEDWQQRARRLLGELEKALTERQSIFCSRLLPRSKRLEIEKDLLVRASTDPVAADLEMVAGLNDIFKHDTYCGDIWNTDKRQNGKLLWLYLKYWELIVELKKFRSVERALLDEQGGVE